MTFNPKDIPDPYSPDRRYCLVEGCGCLQRNHGYKIWGKYCDKHHKDPELKEQRRLARIEYKKKKLLERQLKIEKLKQVAFNLRNAHRECIVCKKIKSPNSFRGNLQYNKSFVYPRICNDCQNKKAKSRRLKAYGADDRWYQENYLTQNGCCAICGEKYKILCVDHCHDTISPRGLLCRHCNLALGLLKDDLDILASASSYLINSRCKIA